MKETPHNLSIPDPRDPFPKLTGELIEAIKPLLKGSPDSDIELATALVSVGSLIALTRLPPEHVAAMLQLFADQWRRRAAEELGLSRRKTDTAARIHAAVAAVLDIAAPPQTVKGQK